MLKISQSQWNSFAQTSQQRFHQICFDHLRDQLADYWQHASDEQLLSIIDTGVDRGRKLGFETEEQLIKFIELFSFCGPEFGELDTDRPALALLFNPDLRADWPKFRSLIISARE